MMPAAEDTAFVRARGASLKAYERGRWLKAGLHALLFWLFAALLSVAFVGPSSLVAARARCLGARRVARNGAPARRSRGRARRSVDAGAPDVSAAAMLQAGSARDDGGRLLLDARSVRGGRRHRRPRARMLPPDSGATARHDPWNDAGDGRDRADEVLDAPRRRGVRSPRRAGRRSARDQRGASVRGEADRAGVTRNQCHARPPYILSLLTFLIFCDHDVPTAMGARQPPALV